MESNAKLKWRCRRGTKELDFLLTNYLDKHFTQSNKEEQKLFVQLLTCQDSQLILFLLGDQLPKSKELEHLVKKIRNQSYL